VPAAIAIQFAPDGQTPPPAVRHWLEANQLPSRVLTDADEVMSIAFRSRPRLVSIDARTHPVAALKACKRLKADSFTGVVPCVVWCRDDDKSFAAAFDAGADEVIRDGTSESEASFRLTLMLRRSDRDTFVHPSTRLPGAIEIEKEIARRMQSGPPFAVCYADLDHFKEYNDRYSWYDGDRVIRILSKILHDVVKGICGEAGFVGHIGGDDFIFIIPVNAIQDACGEVVACFDVLIPFQYSEQDRRAGYFFGKDRRGQLHKVPLMTVSIGVVTNERRRFTEASQVSELATEMKSYAKTLPGSIFTVDRRTDTPPSGSSAADADASTLGAVGGEET
jgi:diguanylate cyclase (GGDEF)-like protein